MSFCALLLTALTALQAPRATLVPDPPEAQIGQPVEWLLDVEHAQEARVRLPAALAEDRAWVWTAPRSLTRGPDPQAAGRAHTLVRWRGMALEPGERAPPAFEIEVLEAGASTKITPEVRALHVLPALGEGEDTARPLLGFREPAASAEGARRAGLVLAIGLVLAAALGFVLVRRARRRIPLPAARTPLSRLEELVQRHAADAGSARECIYDLSRLLRETIDGFLGLERSGLTDADWIVATQHDERLPAGVRSTSARLLAGAERVKYAQETPTRFAVEQTFGEARGALEALAATPPPTPLGREKAA